MKRIIPIVILIFCLLLLPFTSASSTQISNESIADTAILYDGKSGGTCIEFVRKILEEIGVSINRGSYRNAYLEAKPKPIEVSINEATKGDIIQLSNDSDESTFYEGMHTAIILSKNSNGSFKVVDSNSNWDKIIHVHSWDPYSNIENNKDSNLSIHVYRFGILKTQLELQTDITPSQNADQSVTPSEKNFFGVVSDWFKNLWNNIIDFFTVEAEETPTTQSATIAASQESQSEIQDSVTTETKVTIPLPSKPSLTSPYNWYQSLGSAPTLIWKGDENSISYYVIVNSSNTGDIKSGWINSTSWRPNLPNENYIYSWKVKAKNSQGAEGPWSDEFHFSITSTTLQFEGDISFNPQSPSSADKIKIFASTTGWGGVGVTLRVSVNTAPDGSSNGEWRILKELGVPKFNEEDAPVWDTKEWSNGTYKIRVEAKGPDDPNWQNSVIIESIYKLIDKLTITSEPTTTITTTVSNTAPPIEDLYFNPGSQSQVGATVKIHTKATWNSAFRSMRLKIDGNVVYELSTPEWTYDWNTSGYSEGNHTIRLEVAAIGDDNWDNPSVKEATYTLTASTITTPTNPPFAPPIEDLSFSPASPSQIGTTVNIHLKATWNSAFRSMRLKIDGNVVYELSTPEWNYDWNTSGYSTGSHAIRLEVAAQGDNSWNSPSVREVSYSLTAKNVGLNKPTLSSPSNGALFPPGTDITLRWNSVSGVTEYLVEIWGGQYGGTHNTLGGWQTGTLRHIGTMSPGNVLWKVKARNSSGVESPWSDEWNFTPQ